MSSYFSCNELPSELVKESWKRTVYTKKESIGSWGKEMKSHTRKKYIILASASSATTVNVQRPGNGIYERSRGRAYEAMIYIYPSYLLSIKTIWGMQ